MEIILNCQIYYKEMFPALVKNPLTSTFKFTDLKATSLFAEVVISNMQ